MTNWPLHERPLNFRLGDPDPRLLPAVSIHQSFSVGEAVTHLERGLEYGPERGLPELVELVAAVATKRCFRDVSTSEIMITNGATQALELVTTQLATRGAWVLVDESTYEGAAQLFRDRGLRVVSMRTTVEEDLVDALIRRSRTIRRNGGSVAFAYLIPTFNNPSGAVLSIDERQKLASVAASEDVWLVEDDTYSQIHFGKPTRPIYSLATAKVINIESFSKIVAPGLRLGRILGPSDFIDSLLRQGSLQMGGGAGPFSSEIALSIMRNADWETQLIGLRKHYGRKASLMHEALSTGAPPGVSWNRPDGGFFIWLKCDTSIRSATIEERAKQEGVLIKPGAGFLSARESPPLEAYFRLAYSYESDSAIDAGIDALCRLFRQ